MNDDDDEVSPVKASARGKKKVNPIVHKDLVDNATQFVSFSGFNWDEADVEFNRGILQRFKLADLEDASDARVKVLIVNGKVGCFGVFSVFFHNLLYFKKARTIKVLQAIARGLCIVDEQWLNESVEAEKLLKPEDKMVDFFPGAAKSRQINMDKDPRVFEEKLIYVPPRTKVLQKKEKFLETFVHSIF